MAYRASHYRLIEAPPRNENGNGYRHCVRLLCCCMLMKPVVTEGDAANRAFRVANGGEMA